MNASWRIVVGLAACAPLALADATPSQQVTWAKDVMPIVQENCQGCHRPGQIGPFSLMSFDEARPWAKSIKQKVSARQMPPYFADPASLPMKGDLNLSQGEMDTFAAWVDQGAKLGNEADLPAPRKFETFEGGWQLKKPDVVMQMPEPFGVGAGQDDLYQCFSVPFGLDQDVWLKGVEFKPDNTKVVHHFILFEDKSGKFKEYDAETPEPGCECADMEKVLQGTSMIKMWAPANVQPFPPVGVAQRVLKGSNLILQVHYHNVTGEDQSDQSSFAFHLAQPGETIMKEIRGQLVVQPNLNIKAGDPASKFQATYKTPKDITLFSSGVHMHYRGKDMGMWAKRPGDTDETTIVWVPRYDFNWQLTYEFTQPWKAPAGTEFTMRCTFDNSANNPFNPDPTVDVHWGLYSTQEMAFSGYSYTLDEEALNITPVMPAPEVLSRFSGSTKAVSGD